MKLTNKAIRAINSNTRIKISLAMGCSFYTVDRWVRENADNGDLTKAVPLKIIKEETGLGSSEILEKSNVTA